jgi:SulP family sulfate permease
MHLTTNTAIKNTLAGVTTSLAMVPEVVAFALLAHVNPLVGLYSAFILGLVTSVFGGRPGLISGGAGSLAVVSVALVVTHGVEYLFACIILMGIIQFAFGYFKLGKLIKLVSPAVMTGFVNGLALVIFLAQFHQLRPDDAWLQGQILYNTIGLILLTVLAVYVTPKITRRIPASLIGILIASGVALVFNLDVQYVKDIASVSGALPEFNIPMVPFTWETLAIITPYAFILAAIGLIETLLTANLVDDFVHNHKPNHKTHPNKESMAQGAGNVLTGFFGGMGGCAMIGQTVINLEAGGFHRLAGIVQSLCILAYILFASVVIENIPLAALIGVMFVVCYHTFDWKSLKLTGKSKEDIIIITSVTILTVILNLAYAVLIGIIITSMMHYWKHIEGKTT